MTRLVFVGPHLGRHPGCVPSPAEDLRPLLEAEGHEVLLTSSARRAPVRALAMFRDLCRWRRRVDLAVLSVFSGRSFRLAEVLARWMSWLGIRQVHVLHGGGLPDLIASNPQRVRRVLGRADAVVAPSGWLAEAVAPLGVDARVIPNVLDLSHYELHEPGIPPAPRLLWMRTFHDVYRPELALRALARLRADGVAATLTMAGQDKGLEAPCRRLAAQLGVDGCVEFPGFLDPAGKRRAFAAHDVFLATNRVDNTPVTVLEAMASGLPVVATAVGGVPHLLEHGRAGLLVADAPGEEALALEAEMAVAVRRLVADPELARRLSAAGRQRAEAASWPRVRAAWMGLFADLAGDLGSE